MFLSHHQNPSTSVSSRISFPAASSGQNLFVGNKTSRCTPPPTITRREQQVAREEEEEDKEEEKVQQIDIRDEASLAKIGLKWNDDYTELLDVKTGKPLDDF